MTRIAITALAAILSASASAHASVIRFAGDNAYVGYGDLDLQSHADRLKLTGRIHTAASRLCNNMESNIEPLSIQQQCYRVAVQSGVEQMEQIAGPNPRG